MTCRYAVRRLAAYLDNELSVEHRIAIDAHLAACPGCMEVVRDGRELSELVQGTGSEILDGDAIERIRARGEMVLSRVSAEQEVARTSGLRRLVEDVHLVWLSSAACLATAVCALIATAVVGQASIQSPNSVAATLAALSNPGSNENPVKLRTGMVVPHLSPLSNEAMMLTLPDPMPVPGRSTGMTLSVIVTQEGTVSGLSVLGTQGGDPTMWVSLVDSAATARFAPAKYAGAPVAVNMVWVVEQVTIRGDAESEFPSGPAESEPSAPAA